MPDSWLLQNLWLIALLPLVAAAATAAFGAKVLRERSHWPCVIAAIGAAALSFLLLVTVAGAKLPGDAAGASAAEDRASSDSPHAALPVSATSVAYDWLRVGDYFKVPITFRADPLTALMLVMVTFVGALIVIFAVGYMHGDRGYWRFFASVALFLFSMTGLVLASNLLLIYVFWELVGLCSYLLIGFWYERPAAAAAAKKAFLVNRIGDFGFALGVLMVWVTFRTLDYDVVFARATGLVQTPHGVATITTICLLLFCGAVGKSAQFPLHVWLPDAMEGPTPVSALIHAATMVTAGVYMVARFSPLFLLAPTAQLVVSIIGGFTALLAALVALTQTDLKRILAYSTVSQLGYMFLGLGCGAKTAVVAGIFHVFTHAFFKALLFLGAGSVMHAMGGVIDITRIGGLRRRMPITYATFACGAAALAGVPLLSGFWSKDAILAELAVAGAGTGFAAVYRVLLCVGLLTALLTAFYTFRAFFTVFWGDEKIPTEAGDHAHESPAVMTYPLIVLAIFALGIGGVLHVASGGLNEFLGRTPGLTSDVHAAHSYELMVLSGLIAVTGVALAWWMYGRKSDVPDDLARRFRVVHELTRAKFKFDEAYFASLVLPVLYLAAICRVADNVIVDGLVRAVAAMPAFFGRTLLRPLQNGLVQFYALAMIGGLVVLVLALGLGS